jgi:capsular exopolysaccharide synthesis family protein
VESQKQFTIQPLPVEGIDFNKLRIVFRSNWIWLVSVFLAVNLVAYLAIRYTKNVYESTSVLKLDVKQEATEFGIKSAIEDQNLNLISGEIEIIQSRLFLSRVLDSSALDVSYYSIGRVLNDELYQSHPFHVTYKATDQLFFNTPIYFTEREGQEFSLTVGDGGSSVQGRYNASVKLGGLELMFRRNSNFAKGDEIGYFFVINSNEALLNYLLTNLTAEPLNFNANTVQISFKDHNPFKAHDVLNRIDTVYLQYSNDQKNLATKQKIDWISHELVNIEKSMENYENYFENFTLQNRTNNLDEDLKTTVENINSIDSQRFNLTQQLREVDHLIDGLNSGQIYVSFSQRQLLPPGLAENLVLLETLNREQERLKLSYNEITFAYREKQKELETVLQNTQKQLVEIRELVLKRLQHANEAKERLEREFANLPDKSTEFSKNLRYYKLYEQFYLSLMQSKSEFEITQAGSTPDFKILSPATMPRMPISPNKLMIAGIGFVASIVLMLFILGTLYLVNNKITSITEIEKIDRVPVLGVVPSSRYFDEGVLHVTEHPKSIVSEAIRTLRTNLDFFNIRDNRKVIAISSTVSGEGKSFIAMNLGAVMALSKKKVILLDLDMRKHKANPPADIGDNTRGMSTILINKDNWSACVAKTSLDFLDFLPSGPHPPNPSELLMNGAFESLLLDLKKNYDYIILDTPPVGLVTDGIMAMKRSDISIYIFRANYSKKEFLFNLQRIININKFSNITTLLNAVPETGEQGYGYGYYEDTGGRMSWFKKHFKV